MLTIRRTKVFRGPSIWGPMPVILLEIDIGELEARLSRETPAFFERLTQLIPSLSSHGDVVSGPYGGAQRLLIDQVAVALQNLAGAELTYARTLPTDDVGVYSIVYEYTYREVGRAAGNLAVRVLNHLLCSSEPGLDFAAELKEKIVRVAERQSYGLLTAALVDAAQRRGIPIERLDRDPVIVQFGNGKYQRRVFSGTMTSDTASLAIRIASNKELTSRLLHAAGIPVPRSAGVRNAEEAVHVATRLKYPVVLKPLHGNQGRGVMINLVDEDAVRNAFAIAARESRASQVVVETFIPGKDYRILVVNNQVVAVAERVPAHVIGDGKRTVAELIEITNADPHRGVGHEKILTRIVVDAQTIEVLAKQELTLEDVPAEGRFVQLKLTANLSTGGTSIDRTDDIHPDNIEVARQAAMVVGLDVAGIDFITPDIASSVREQRGGIVEVNSKPGLRMHTHPTEGRSRDVSLAIIDMLFPPGQPSRVPIVAVTGTNGKTTTARMIAHIMKTAGKKVGMTTTDGIYIDGIRIASGDLAGAVPARKVLKNPAIDYAVLETARGSIIRDGLGFDRCNVAVVTNVGGDHLGLRGINTLDDMARVKAVVPSAVAPDGASVLNADNPYTVEMARVARGEIIFFSMDEENPVIRDHLRERGKAVVLRPTRHGEMITLIEHRRDTSLLLAEEIPATMDGRIRVNIQNAMAAAAAALAQGVSPEIICPALSEFHASYEQTPGRFNLLEINNRVAIIDYCHNLHGLEAMVDVVKSINAERKVGMIGVPGDRSDDHISAFGALASQMFDELVIREDLLRGRKRGEVPALLQAAALSAGLPADRIQVVLGEVQAVEVAMERAGENGLIILLALNYDRVWNALNAKRPELSNA